VAGLDRFGNDIDMPGEGAGTPETERTGADFDTFGSFHSGMGKRGIHTVRASTIDFSPIEGNGEIIPAKAAHTRIIRDRPATHQSKSRFRALKQFR
jgi:hypothetical protein